MILDQAYLDDFEKQSEALQQKEILYHSSKLFLNNKSNLLKNVKNVTWQTRKRTTIAVRTWIVDKIKFSPRKASYYNGSLCKKSTLLKIAQKFEGDWKALLGFAKSK